MLRAHIPVQNDSVDQTVTLEEAVLGAKVGTRAAKRTLSENVTERPKRFSFRNYQAHPIIYSKYERVQPTMQQHSLILFHLMEINPSSI